MRYVANSHLHFDHCGGNEFFPRATFLVQKAEMEAARRPGFAPGYIEETLEAVGARDLANRPLSAMSGGERQRLLLAQALIGQPKLLLLDEPLMKLHQRHQEVAIDVVRKVCRERGITILFSAHEMLRPPRTLDRVLYLGNGQAVLGTVDEVISARAVEAVRHRYPGGARRGPHLRHVARARRGGFRPSTRP